MHLVVNASPFILLCKAGQIELLNRVAVEVVMPRGVLAEIKAQPNDSSSKLIDSLNWLTIADVVVPDSIKAWDLGVGESEVVAYALQSKGYRPLLDDAEGKACALSYGLQPIGTGGFLIKAKQTGSLKAVAPVLNEIRTKGLWVSDEVSAAILKLANELV
jgi:predicted nucleic acid-binding protein